MRMKQHSTNMHEHGAEGSHQCIPKLDPRDLHHREHDSADPAQGIWIWAPPRSFGNSSSRPRQQHEIMDNRILTSLYCTDRLRIRRRSAPRCMGSNRQTAHPEARPKIRRRNAPRCMGSNDISSRSTPERQVYVHVHTYI